MKSYIRVVFPSMKTILIDPSQERRILDLRKIGFRDVQVLGRYTYSHAHAPLTVHDHGNMMEICYLAEGSQFYRIGDEEFFLNGGDILINYPHEKHGTGMQREGRGTLYWMIVRPPSHKTGFLGLSYRDGRRLWEELLELPSRRFRAMSDTRKKLDTLFSLLEKRIGKTGADKTRDSFCLLDVRNHFQRFLIDAVLAARSDSKIPVSPEIRGATELIKNEIEVFHTVRTLAKSARLSESRFKHRFKEEIGTSPADYQLRCKIDFAARMLLVDGETIIRTAFFLGFSSSQYFSTVFRRYMGLSPHEYRVFVRKNGSDPG